MLNVNDNDTLEGRVSQDVLVRLQSRAHFKDSAIIVGSFLFDECVFYLMVLNHRCNLPRMILSY